MAEIRRDLVKNNWVAVAPDMALKPHDFPINKRGIDPYGNNLFCPFCKGNESYTPPEIFARRDDQSAANTPDWSIRVVPNKFSVFSLGGELEKTNAGIYRYYDGVGRQEVIIETPDHDIDLHDYSPGKIAEVLQVIKIRYNAISQDERIKYIQVYKNRGIFAGASIQHSHSQMMGLPYFPQCNSGLLDYFKKHNQCLVCSIIKQEQECNNRIIYESDYFLIINPYASRFPYETWIIPKEHDENFGLISDAQIDDLATICRAFMQMMVVSLQDSAYNFVLNTAPINMPYQPGHHWYMEIVPRLLVQTGVDISVGLYMNPVAPELAAAQFREDILKYF